MKRGAHTSLQGFLAEGLQRTSAGLGSIIIDSQPLTVALLTDEAPPPPPDRPQPQPRQQPLPAVRSVFSPQPMPAMLLPEAAAPIIASNTATPWIASSTGSG